MLDDLRQQADTTPFEAEASKQWVPPRRHFLGMTPFQRFVIALMLLFITCLLSSFCLLVTEKIVIPGL